MIPQRRPPFGVGHVIKSIFGCWNRPIVADVEEAYARAFGMPHAVLLPSARAGICWALKATIEKGTRVICTAYTCRVVWEAIARSGGQLHLVDIKENSFLMDEDAIKVAQIGNYAIVLSEIYGYTYDLSQITLQPTNTQKIRIVDMTMTVPTAEHFVRLDESDFAVISFGAGKCMYAGWGGIGFTRDTKLASSVKNIRNQTLLRPGMAQVLKRSLRMLALNLMYERFAYGFLKKIKDARQLIRERVHPHPTDPSLHLSWEKPPSKEWFLPTTYVDRSLMLYNLEQADRYIEHRRSLADRYERSLRGTACLVCPEIPPYTLSHYAVIVKPAMRPLLVNYLLKAGIEVSTLFDFPKSLPKREFPHASKTASEILNLPLYTNLCFGDIDRISESLVRGCLKYS
jgi:dTDP-4-amino-4,6-dideoxygalactose transaminase